jgi:hypothetical protein
MENNAIEIIVKPSDLLDLDRQIQSALVTARGLVVTEDKEYVGAIELGKDIKALEKEIDLKFDPLKDRYQIVLKMKKSLTEPKDEALALIKMKVNAYQEKQERLRREEAARQLAEAQKREEETRLAEATAFEAAGEPEMAEEIISAPMELPPIELKRAVPSVAGSHTSEVWSAEVTSLLMLVRHVASHPSDINLLMSNEPACNSRARSIKDVDLGIPGLRGVRTISRTFGKVR